MYWKEITVITGEREQFLDVTAQVALILSKLRALNGVCYLFVPHTTAGITINENADPNVVTDLLKSLARIVPRTGDYRHAEGNSDAHLKASIVGFSSQIPVIQSKLALGTWQGIYFCEFDGPRNRKLLIGFSGEQE